MNAAQQFNRKKLQDLNEKYNEKKMVEEKPKYNVIKMDTQDNLCVACEA
jgi:hypothetical protein